VNKNEDTIRILRIIEYVGPRNWVEQTVARSITERSGRVGGQLGEQAPNEAGLKWRIRGTTLGSYPDIMEEE
jgi:hypothetical protein